MFPLEGVPGLQLIAGLRVSLTGDGQVASEEVLASLDRGLPKNTGLRPCRQGLRSSVLDRARLGLGPSPPVGVPGEPGPALLEGLRVILFGDGRVASDEVSASPEEVVTLVPASSPRRGLPAGTGMGDRQERLADAESLLLDNDRREPVLRGVPPIAPVGGGLESITGPKRGRGKGKVSNMLELNYVKVLTFNKSRGNPKSVSVSVQ